MIQSLIENIKLTKNQSELEQLLQQQLSEEEEEEDLRKISRIQLALIQYHPNLILKLESYCFTQKPSHAKLAIQTILLNYRTNQPKLINLLKEIIKRYQLIDYYQLIFNNNNHNNNNLIEWTQFINTLFSIPDKLSPFIFYSSTTDQYQEFHSKTFLARISRQFYSLVQFVASIPNPTQAIQPLAFILNKFINLGFISLNIHQTPSDDFLSSIWSQFITAPIDPNHSSDQRLIWNSIISSLPRTELKSFLVSLLLHLQSHLSFQHDHHQFSNDPHALAIERAGAEILKFYLGDWGSQNHLGTTDIFELVTEIVTSTDGWTIPIARWIARWVSLSTRVESTLTARSQLAKSSLHAFASAHQIAHGSPSHHAFLLLLLLLTSSPIDLQSTNHLPLDPVFVDAIQRSLGSLRSQFRLLGMLMAELMSDFNRLPGSTKLDFGHDFDALDNPDNRICVAIRELSNHWNHSPSEPLWRDLLSSMAAAEPSTPITGSHQNQPCSDLKDSRENKQIVSSTGLSSLKRLTDPNQLTLTELRLRPDAPIPNRVGNPQIEVLHTIPSADPSLEAYEISEEDLQSLYPPLPCQQQHDSSNDKTTPSLEPEFDYAQMKDKPLKPVYLDQLSQFLKDAENYEKVKVGLIQAESLIRRKSDWGTELVEHALDLTFTLLNLQDHFDLEGFDRYRQAALVALVVSVPLSVGPCIIEQLFYHQYSITQRVSMLDSLVRAVLEFVDPLKLAALTKPDEAETEGFKKIQSDTIHRLLLEYQSSSSSTDRPSQAGRGGSNSVLLPDRLCSLEYVAQQPAPTKLSARLIAQRKQYPSRDSDIDRHDHQLEKRFDKPHPRVHPADIRIQVERTLLSALVGRLAWYLDHHPPLTGSLTGAGSMILWEPLILLKLIETIKLFSLLLLSHSSSSTIIDPQNASIIKDVLRLFLSLLRFLHSSHHETTEHGQFTDVNSSSIGTRIVTLIIHLITTLSPSSTSSSTVYQSLRPDTPSLPSNLTHFDLLFSDLISLVRADNLFDPFDPGDHQSLALLTSSSSSNLNRFMDLVSQILDLC